MRSRTKTLVVASGRSKAGLTSCRLGHVGLARPISGVSFPARQQHRCYNYLPLQQQFISHDNDTVSYFEHFSFGRPLVMFTGHIL